MAEKSTRRIGVAELRNGIPLKTGQRHRLQVAEGFVDLVGRDAQGGPLAFAAYVVTLPTGGTLRGNLDEHGRARVGGVHADGCRVHFLEPQLPSVPAWDRPAKLSNARWVDPVTGVGVVAARSGKRLQLLADIENPPSGLEAKITIFERDQDGDDDVIATLDAGIRGTRIEAEWSYLHTSDADEEGSENGYTKPEYFFVCRVGDASATSPVLEFADHLDLEGRDPQGNPLAHARFRLRLADGSERTGKLDAEGRCHVEKIPPGAVQVRFFEEALPPIPESHAAPETRRQEHE